MLLHPEVPQPDLQGQECVLSNDFSLLLPHFSTTPVPGGWFALASGPLGEKHLIKIIQIEVIKMLLSKSLAISLTPKNSHTGHPIGLT